MTATLACGGGRTQPQEPAPLPTAPLPTAGLAGQRVSVFPLTLVVAEDSLRWESYLVSRSTTLASADSVIAVLLLGRVPEIPWVTPDELRHAARRAAGLAPDPSQMGTAILRADRIVDVPDPLRSQLRTLVALAGGGGGRYVLIPAALVYRRPRRPDARAARASGPTAAPGSGTAELSVVVVDVRQGRVLWRTVARGDGRDPWAALTEAVKALTPGLP